MGKGYRTQLRQLRVSSAKPKRFITETRAPVAGTLWTRGKLSWQWFNCLCLSLKRDFLALACIPWAHLTNSGTLCHYLKEKVTVWYKQKTEAEFFFSWRVPSSRMCWLIYTEELTQRWVLVQITTNTWTPKHTQTFCSCSILGAHSGSSSIHVDSRPQHTGRITAEYHYLKAFADLDRAWSAASLVSSSEQENRAARTNTLPNPCWSQRSQEMKCKGKARTPPPQNLFTPPPLLPRYRLPWFLSPRSSPSHLKNGVTFTTLMEKCCQRLSQSAAKFQKVSQSNPTLVKSKCYISAT